MQSISYSSCWRDNMSTSELSMDFNGLGTKAGLFHLFLNSASFWVKKNNNEFSFFQTWNNDFSLTWMPFQNQKTTKEFHRSLWLYKTISYFLRYHFGTFQVDNDSWPHILQWARPHKNLKMITRTVDFGIPNLKIFLSKKIILRTVGIIENLFNIHIYIRILLIF